MDQSVALLHKQPGLEGDQLPLQEADQIFGELEKDIRWVVAEFQVIARTKVVPRYCLDFDALYPAINLLKNEVDNEESFWGSLLVDLPGFDIVILPGTLFEIFKYTKDLLESQRESLSKPFASAFMSAFSELHYDELSTSIPYHNASESFRSLHIPKRELYLLSILQQKAKFLDKNIPSINKELFYQSVQLLSHGTRIDRILNNRVDAYNFSLTVALNQSPQASKYRYLLVSNSRFVHYLDIHARQYIDFESRAPIFAASLSRQSSPRFPNVDELPYRREVCTPRRAAILQLLALAGEDSARSTAYAWQLLSAISEFRMRLADAISKQQGRPDTLISDISNLRSDNIFLRLISSFESIQRKIDDARQKQRENIKILEKLYDPKNPVEFFEFLNNTISRYLKSEGYSFELKKELPISSISLRCIEKPLQPKFTYKKHVEIVSNERASKGDPAFSYFKYTDYHLFVTYGGASLEEFLSLYNLMRRDVVSKATAGIYNFAAKPARRIIVGTENQIIEVDLQKIEIPIRQKTLVEFFKVAAHEINFIRINSSWFDISFEGNLCAFSSSLPLVDEMSLFVQETCKVDYRAANFKKHVQKLLEAKVG